MDDRAIELVKPNPHIFAEIIPRHPDWWILTVDIKHNQRLKQIVFRLSFAITTFNLR